MKALRSFRSVPRLPRQLDALSTLAGNLRWSWHAPTAELFRSLSPSLWEETHHNPVALLGRLSPEALEELARDNALRYRMERELAGLQAYRDQTTWFQNNCPRETTQPLVAYFCAEYGITESLRIYSGGLSVLAGDHLKAASDLGVPLVAVGLFYHRGFGQQRLSADGWQLEGYPFNDPTQAPLQVVRDASGRPRLIEVLIGGETTFAQVWRADAGRVALYLLDTYIPDNPPHLRGITDRVYGGDRNHRISQEIVLGIGGVRVLAALAISPDVYHMNEGHAAFLIVERLRSLVEGGMPLPAAMEAVRASSVFTTHTPVPAGNEYFAPDLLEYHLRPYLARLGITPKEFFEWGQTRPGPGDFGMTALALRFSTYANGVSRLHGAVSREMWKELWTDVPAEETPIAHITNGAHVGSWVSTEMGSLYDAYLGPRWREEPHEPDAWQRVSNVPPAEMWQAHERCRARLVGFARRRLSRQLVMRRASSAEMRAASEVLDPEVLTIGFARRFATYKRPTLLLKDLERLAALLLHPERPMQLVIAGKAHPDDNPGKEMIRDVWRAAQRPDLRRRIVFLEDYDLYVTRVLVAGVDVWLNTPRRPNEASGTSGMKASLNGVLNVSVLDGWWEEAYRDAVREGIADFGWAIGDGDSGTDDEVDAADASALYGLLEREIAPLFYDRGPDGIPRGWVERMQRSVATLAPRFNTHRMVLDYVRAAYLPAALRSGELLKDGANGAVELGAWKERVRAVWGQVAIRDVQIDAGDVVTARTPVRVRVEVELGGLSPEEVLVQVGVGRLDLVDVAAPLEEVVYTPLAYSARRSTTGSATFDGRFQCNLSGHMGVTVRVLPTHPRLANPFETGCILWA